MVTLQAIPQRSKRQIITAQTPDIAVLRPPNSQGTATMAEEAHSEICNTQGRARFGRKSPDAKKCLSSSSSSFSPSSSSSSHPAASSDSAPAPTLMASVTLLLERQGARFIFPEGNCYALHGSLSQENFNYIVNQLNAAVKGKAPSIGIVNRALMRAPLTSYIMRSAFLRRMHGPMYLALQASCKSLNKEFKDFVNLRVRCIPRTEYFRIDMEVLDFTKITDHQDISLRGFHDCLLDIDEEEEFEEEDLKSCDYLTETGAFIAVPRSKVAANFRDPTTTSTTRHIDICTDRGAVYVFNSLGELVRDHANSLGELVRDHANSLGELVRDHANSLGELVRDHANSLGELVRDHAKARPRVVNDPTVDGTVEPCNNACNRLKEEVVQSLQIALQQGAIDFGFLGDAGEADACGGPGASCSYTNPNSPYGLTLMPLAPGEVLELKAAATTTPKTVAAALAEGELAVEPTTALAEGMPAVEPTPVADSRTRVTDRGRIRDTFGDNLLSREIIGSSRLGQRAGSLSEEEEEEAVGETDGKGAAWQLRPDEVILIAGCTPPALASNYFAITPYLYAAYNNKTSSWTKVFGSMADSLSISRDPVSGLGMRNRINVSQLIDRDPQITVLSQDPQMTVVNQDPQITVNGPLVLAAVTPVLARFGLHHDATHSSDGTDQAPPGSQNSPNQKPNNQQGQTKNSKRRLEEELEPQGISGGAFSGDSEPLGVSGGAFAGSEQQRMGTKKHVESGGSVVNILPIAAKPFGAAASIGLQSTDPYYMFLLRNTVPSKFLLRNIVPSKFLLRNIVPSKLLLRNIVPSKVGSLDHFKTYLAAKPLRAWRLTPARLPAAMIESTQDSTLPVNEESNKQWGPHLVKDLKYGWYNGYPAPSLAPRIPGQDQPNTGNTTTMDSLMAGLGGLRAPMYNGYPAPSLAPRISGQDQPNTGNTTTMESLMAGLGGLRASMPMEGVQAEERITEQWLEPAMKFLLDRFAAREGVNNTLGWSFGAGSALGVFGVDDGSDCLERMINLRYNY
eukprot:gene29760-4972_t